MNPAPRGAVKPGTVGRLSSNRLVMVERVTEFAAYLISLPEQGFTSSSSGDVWDGRYISAPKAVTVSPWQTIEPIPLEELSPINRAFVESGGKMEMQERHIAPPRLVKPVINVNSVVKRGGERRYSVTESTTTLDHRAAIIKQIISELGQPELEKIVIAALQHPKFQSPSSHRAVRWFVNDMVKTGHLAQL